MVNVCVALHRADRWLLSVRGPRAAHAPGTIGLVGGHLENDPGLAVLEATARREAREETGLDLADVVLDYLDSELFVSDTGAPVLAVTFVGEAPADQEPVLAAPDELAAVGWWSLAELEADQTCPPWTVRLIRRAEDARRSRLRR